MAHARAADDGAAERSGASGAGVTASVVGSRVTRGGGTVSAASGGVGVGGPGSRATGHAVGHATEALAVRGSETAHEEAADDDVEGEGSDGSSAQQPPAGLRQEGSVQLPGAVDMLEQLEVG